MENEQPQEEINPTPEETPDAQAPADPAKGTPEQQQALAKLHAQITQLHQQIGTVLIGQQEAVDRLFTALLAGGHVLLEGVPGIAKTLLAKTLAKTIKATYGRIQFTPDLMPSDVVGTTVYSMKTSEFTYKPGPVFANILLIDEINRAPAKTQAALFEVMEEQQVTVDGITHPLAPPFMVVATQNPIEQEGTYRLPEAQLDRFLFRVTMHYPSLEEEAAILDRFRHGALSRDLVESITPLFDPTLIQECQQIVDAVKVSDDMVQYIAQIVASTRQHPDLFLGASPRASLAILRTAKASAAMAGRFFITPDDVQDVAVPALNHRIILTSEKELEGLTPERVIQQLVQQVEVPR